MRCSPDPTEAVYGRRGSEGKERCLPGAANTRQASRMSVL